MKNLIQYHAFHGTVFLTLNIQFLCRLGSVKMTIFSVNTLIFAIPNIYFQTYLIDEIQ